MPKKKAKSTGKGGRKPVLTPDKIACLEREYSYGATDQEAAYICDVCERTVYRYAEKHPEFRQRKEGLKNMNRLVAKKTLRKIMQDPDAPVAQRNEAAQFTLEKSDPDYKPIPGQGALVDARTNIMISEGEDVRARVAKMSDAEILELRDKRKKALSPPEK